MTGRGAGSSPGLRPALGTAADPTPLHADVPVFSVGQTADLLGVQQAFLRRLDDFDIVSPARTGGGQRRYSQSDVRQVTEVLGMVDEGITLVGVARILALQEEVRHLRAELARHTKE